MRYRDVLRFHGIAFKLIIYNESFLTKVLDQFIINNAIHQNKFH